MHLVFLPEKYSIIFYGDANTCVLGQGWEVISTHNSRKANEVGFDHEIAIKQNLPIVSAITAFELLDGT